MQVEVGVLMGGASNLTGPAREVSFGYGTISAGRGKTFNVDGTDGVEYFFAGFGPSYSLPAPGLSGPISVRTAAPVGISGKIGDIKLSPSAMAVSKLVQDLRSWFSGDGVKADETKQQSSTSRLIMDTRLLKPKER